MRIVIVQIYFDTNNKSDKGGKKNLHEYKYYSQQSHLSVTEFIKWKELQFRLTYAWIHIRIEITMRLQEKLEELDEREDSVGSCVKLAAI